MRLLLVEDNVRLASLIREGLDRQGFAVDWCETVDGAGHALKINEYDLLLLDLGLPDGEGLDLVRRLRRRSEEHTSELQSLMRISYAVFCLKKKQITSSI